jgi:hypothetical protein
VAQNNWPGIAGVPLPTVLFPKGKESQKPIPLERAAHPTVFTSNMSEEDPTASLGGLEDDAEVSHTGYPTRLLKLTFASSGSRCHAGPS